MVPINLRAAFGLTTTAAFDYDLNELVLTPAPTNAVADAVDGKVTIVVSGVAVGPWTNPAEPLNVDAEGDVAPSDVLLMINRINAYGSGPLPAAEAGRSAAALPGPQRRRLLHAARCAAGNQPSQRRARFQGRKEVGGCGGSAGSGRGRVVGVVGGGCGGQRSWET